jgi:chromosomal replication initiator protein
MKTNNVLWKKCLKKIEEQILPESFTTWFSPTYLHKTQGRVWTIAVPNDFYKKCLKENYQNLIESTLESLTKDKPEVDFLVEAHPEEVATKTQEQEKPEPASAPRIEISEAPSTLNPKYTFSSFVVGSSNQFAHAASLAVANHPAMAYNPLFLYGFVGLGKTHLLHAIGNAIVEKDPSSRVRYISAESFTVDLIESIKSERMPAFRNRYRPLDVLLVDDIQFIAGKEKTQEEFFFTFNSLYESHKQVVISSDKYPKDIHNMEERLRSRFESGLIADIKPPDLETKMAILYKKADFHQKTLPQEVALFIANNIKSNIRELEGFLLRIIAYASFTQRDLDLKLTKEVLNDFTFDKTRNYTIPIIIKTVATYFNIKVSDIKSKNRSRNISLPRQIAMFLCREYTKSSLPDIGRQFGGKDHTTVIFSYKKISKLIKENNELAKDVQKIMRLIEGK